MEKLLEVHVTRHRLRFVDDAKTATELRDADTSPALVTVAAVSRHPQQRPRVATAVEDGFQTLPVGAQMPQHVQMEVEPLIDPEDQLSREDRVLPHQGEESFALPRACDEAATPVFGCVVGERPFTPRGIQLEQ